jgi:hypothetical protein
LNFLENLMGALENCEMSKFWAYPKAKVAPVSQLKKWKARWRRCHNPENNLKIPPFFFFFLFFLKFLEHILRPQQKNFFFRDIGSIFNKTRARYAWPLLQTWLSLIHKHLGFSNFNCESWKWLPVATFKSWTNKSALSFFDFRPFHLQKQVLSQI